VLKNAKTKHGEKTTVVDFSPKAITTNELYGSVNMYTREWKDGILSKTMRDLGLIPDTHPKWIMLDGDLDANWIESMNSVMDDSRLLTLPSNERIPLKMHMKMIFEIRDLNYATPATATRAGIVCMSDKEGVQWQCYVQSWIKKCTYPEPFKEQLALLFDKYCSPTLTWIRKSTKIQVPYVEVALISSLCSLLDARLPSHNLEAVEAWFVFCIIFATGSSLAEVDGVDYRKAFSNWWKNEMKTIKYPTKGLVFDLYVRDSRLEEWSTLVEPLQYRSTTPMGEITVPTTETVCLDYFMKALIEVSHPVMLIGLAGCGKTQSCTGLLKRLDHEVFMGYKMNMSYYTDSTMLQTMMEIPLEKKAGKLYAPPGKLQMIYFIDDLNMPALDKYNTQSAIELIKQKQDYNHWYDRVKIQVKDIGGTQYLCCMNPTAGSFTVNPRLQRHFWTSSVQFPEQNALNLIYSTFMKGHFDTLSFKVPVQEISNWVIKAALSFHTQVSANFRKTAQNMHYEFNIRHMSGVFSGLLKAKPSEFMDAEKLVLLWIHESERIYGDRLVSMADLKKLRQLTEKIAKQMFSKHNLQKYFQEKNPEPIIFAPFSRGHHNMEDGGVYDKIKDMERLSQILQEAMRDYDSTFPSMDLVLFEDAMKHVARISRIISSPSGHPLLVGVGGSGRQSLSRLSAFICQALTHMIIITSSYGLNDLKTDLQYMYKRAGEKDEGVMFLFTDNQIADERFFVFFNDLLSSGEITDLYPSEDKDSIRNAVRSAAKGLGIVDTPDNLWAFYISRVRKNLHMSLCFSPVGDGLWSRARKFPALVNCTTIDWFQPWPEDALLNVAQKFLTKLDELGAQDSPARLAIVDFFPHSFEAVNQLSQKFIQEEKRFAYTTPKSFLELIKLYSGMLGKQVFALADKKSRLSSGLIKLRATQEEVANLEEDLQEKAVIVKEKAEKADTFAEEVGREKTKVNTEAEKANIEAVKCAQIAQQVAEKKEDCMRDLDAALPLVNQAEAALDVLDKKEFNELKALTRPPDDVAKVCETALHLLAGIDPMIETDKKGRAKDKTWKGIQKMMTDPNKFLAQLKGFKLVIDEGKVPPQNVEEARKIKDGLGEDFYPENMKKKSQAAGGLSEFVINIIKYYDVVCQVEPKKRSLQEAAETLEKANERHREVTAMVKDYGAVRHAPLCDVVWLFVALHGNIICNAAIVREASRQTFSRSSVAAACLPETFVPPTRDGNEGVYVSEDSFLAEVAGSIKNLGTWQHWYRPPWFLKQGDLMTLFAALCRSSADLTFKRHIITTKDSGALALDLVVKDGRGRTAPGIASQAPVVLLLPGLGGSSQGGYVKNMANKLTSCGFAVGVLNMRGCAGCSLRTPRVFSAYRGSTNDVREAVDYVRSHLVKPPHKEKPVFLLGWSLGANILINTLAEQGRDTSSQTKSSFLNGGVALCATHCLVRCGRQAREHWVTKYVYSRFVTRNLLQCLQPALSRYGSGPVPGWNGTDIRVDSLRLESAQEVFDIDEALIRRMFGYNSVDEYYYDASSCRRVEQVAVPLLMVSAADDPMSTGWVPFDKVRANPNIMLAYTSHGGHLGWHDDSNALRSPWVEAASAAFLQKLKSQVAGQHENLLDEGETKTKVDGPNWDPEIPETSAIAEKEAVMAEAERCQNKLDMAQRLVGALSANGVIWEQTVEKTSEELIYIPGDSLVACSFASYLGVFSRDYRETATASFVDFLQARNVPLGPEISPLQVLSTEAEQARWCANGLPSDRVSLENGAIMSCSQRWSLVIDPQLQGIVWIKNKESENNLQITRMGAPRMVQLFEKSIETGKSVLVENMGEHIDAVLQPVIARNTIKRGARQVLKLGDKEISYNDKFRLFMQTKLSNPHYPPEIQAECTVINFTVTEQGLQDQLLFLVVKLERPDLARTKSELIQQQNEFKVRLADLESYLLEKLAGAEGDILEDTELVFGLEDAKFTSDEVKEKVKVAQATEAKINTVSENYRLVANRGSLLFFLMMELCKMHSFYKYSLDAFVMVVTRAISLVTLRKVKEFFDVFAMDTKPEKAMAFIHKQVEVLEAVSMATGTSEWSMMPPLSGKAFASVAALEAVLGLLLGLLERTDFNPGLAACLMTPLGRKLQETMLTVLGDHQKLTSEVNDMRWQLAAFRRLAHARYGLQWHADTALHIAAQAGWTLFHLAKLDGYFLQRLGLHEQTLGDSQENFTDALPLLWQEPSEVDMEGDVQTDWTLELRSALHSGGSLWHLDKGLLRFLLSMVLRKGDNVCDLGAFGGHYSEWLNDTGLVSAYAFDAIPGVEEITKGAVRHARLDVQHLELVDAGCDVVLCLEVMEHILPSLEQQALSNLGLHTKRALVLSWAPPWVPGPGHINQRPPEEAWAVVERQTGLARQPILSEGAQASSSLSWEKRIATVEQMDVEGDLKEDTGLPEQASQDDAGADAVAKEEEEEEEEEIVELTGQELTNRVKQLEGVVTFAVFAYLRRGLLDADKLTVASMLALKILVRSGEVHPEELNILIRAPVDPLASPMPDTTRSWLTEHQWAQLKTLEQISVFKTGSNALTSTLEQDSLGWKRWFAEEKAEAADLPRACRDLSSFHRLFLLRVLRPDRIGSALTHFVQANLGQEFVEQSPFDMSQVYEESTCLTPIFFVLFPGTDPTPVIEATAAELGLTQAAGSLHNISMGQGQENVAINAINKCARDGHWVVLQNIHLMQEWLKQLERSLELIEEFVHPNFRCILTSEPPSALQGPLWPLLPEAILQKCIKIADEAPTDLKSNLRRSYAKFSQDQVDACHKPREYKATLFALCFFHALVLGRIKFGPQGWSKKYPFNDGDLTICAQVLCNYLNNSEKIGSEVPWPDIRYIFGEIMYGGHITDQWDRRVCNTYLVTLVIPELLSNMSLAPGLKSPDASKMEYASYQKYIEERFPTEMPQLFGLHPNAEIGFLTSQGINIFKTVQMVSGADSGAATVDLLACIPLIAKYKDELPPDLDMPEIRGRLREEDYTPYVITSLQESDRMNVLVGMIRNSLTELELGISGALNITEGMEALSTSLQLNRVNDSWQKLAYPSLKPLSGWFADLLSRMEQLVEWTNERSGLLKSIWISGLFNPMAFLTAVMQVTARNKQLPLDYMTNRATILNILDSTDIVGLPVNGVHIHGLFLEGASWEEGKGDDEGYISDSKMKELHPEMPVINIFSVHINEMSWENMYHCPVFITPERGATYVTQVNVRMDPDDDEKRWILAGAALVMTDD
ncbi:ODA11, partial [Symbiodinium sp. CCMP2456]